MIVSRGALAGATLVSTEIGLLHLHQLAAISAVSGHPEVCAQGASRNVPLRCLRTVGSHDLRRVVTDSGFCLTGRAHQQIAVVDAVSGTRRWTRIGDLAPGVVVPMRFGEFVGAPRQVPMPVLGQAYYTGDWAVRVPETFTTELAELVGYFMGDGSLHSKGLRFCVAAEDTDVLRLIESSVFRLFGITPKVRSLPGYHEVSVHSTRLVAWWSAAGLGKKSPRAGHSGKGWTPHVPAVLRETNSPAVYAAFLRGLFEADGTVNEGVPSLSTSSAPLAASVRSMLTGLGLLTTTRETTSGLGGRVFQIRVRNLDYAMRYRSAVGFMGRRKSEKVRTDGPARSGRRDRIFLPRQRWNDVAPRGHPRRAALLQSLRKHGSVPRQLAESLGNGCPDPRLERALGDFYETVRAVVHESADAVYHLCPSVDSPLTASGFVVR
ncbi:MAG TPA: LAGLIDADG family homing endonuclease [Yinghuangia sp.]|uniref:LAGLIDADG family homing endonuclease n=1 Tax=Yinghuangia sp. YIM S10712 TaxID=3436930 RepID=UPI002C23EBA0|nr:LAGLIDADG family homing endonuclease [Yinghuangia sp.]